MQTERYLPRIREESSLSTEISHATANSGEILSSRYLWAKREPQEYPTNWTDERVELLKKLWADGVSAGLIAGELGEVTRSAVIGKVHRLGLKKRSTSVRIPTPRSPKSFQKCNVKFPRPPREAFVKPLPPKPRAEPVLIEAQPPLMKPTLALQNGDCRFPIGDPLEPGFGFCGHPREHGAFCAAHGAISYRGCAR